MAKKQKIDAFKIPFDRKIAMPLYVQTEHYIVSLIKSGEFEEGTLLPGLRTLARYNRVSKNTIEGAYANMCSKGWLKSHSGRRSEVCFKSNFDSEIQEIIRQKKETGQQSWKYPLDRELPDPVPMENFRLGKRKPTHIAPETKTEKEESEPRILPVREVVLKMESHIARYISHQTDRELDARNLCLINGQQHIFSYMALWNLTGKMVMVVYPCSQVLQSVLNEAGILPCPIHLHPGDEGINPKKVETLCKMFPMKALVLDTYFYQLTVGPLQADTMRQLTALSKTYEFQIYEHNDDRDLWFGPGTYPLLAMEPENEWVVYSGQLSRLFSPTIYFGIIIGPEPFIERLKSMRENLSQYPEDGLIGTVFDLIKSRRFEVHILQQRKKYADLRNNVEAAFKTYLSPYITYTFPPSGMACWFRLNPGLDAEQFTNALSMESICLGNAADYYLDMPQDNIFLLGFAQLDPKEVQPVIRLLAVIFERLRSGTAPRSVGP